MDVVAYLQWRLRDALSNKKDNISQRNYYRLQE